MAISSYIAKRLVASGGTSARYTPAVAVSTVGLSLSLIVMMLSIAVTTGFKNQITEKLNGFNAQIRVIATQTGYDDAPSNTLATPEVIALIRNTVSSFSMSDTVDVAAATTVAGLLKTDTEFAGSAIKAYSEGASRIFENSLLTEGRLPEVGSVNEVAVSGTTAEALGLKVGDKVNAYFIVNGGARPRRFSVTGIFNSNFSDFDNTIAFGSLNTVKGLRRQSADEADAIEVRGLKMEQLGEATRVLQNALTEAYATGRINQFMTCIPVTSTAATFFNWLDMLDTNIAVILVLMGCVCGFMIVSCVLILVLKRVQTIGILKALGATNSQIERVFVYLSIRIIAAGMIIGNIVGLCLIYAQKRFQLLPLNPENYYLTYVPADLTVNQWLFLNAAVAGLAIAVAILPSMLVRSLSPSRTMRWE